MEAVAVINSLHVPWIYFSPETRKQYNLEKKYALYHTDMNLDYILRLEKEFIRLHLKDPDDYCFQQNKFDDLNIYTLCLTDKTSIRLERIGISITERIS